MAKVSNNDIARAIYFLSKDKNESELHSLFKNVTKFLYRKRLLPKSKEILKSLAKIMNKDEGRVVAKVSSSRVLKEEAKKDLKKILGEHYKAKEVILEEVLNKELFGGVKIEVGDEKIDNTVSYKIKKLQEHLTREI